MRRADISEDFRFPLFVQQQQQLQQLQHQRQQQQLLQQLQHQRRQQQQLQLQQQQISFY